MPYLPLRVCARRHGQVTHLQRLVGPLGAPPFRGDGVLALEVVPAATKPPVFEVNDRLAYQLVRAESIVVIQLPRASQQPERKALHIRLVVRGRGWGAERNQ